MIKQIPRITAGENLKILIRNSRVSHSSSSIIDGIINDNSVLNHTPAVKGPIAPRQLCDGTAMHLVSPACKQTYITTERAV